MIKAGHKNFCSFILGVKSHPMVAPTVLRPGKSSCPRRVAGNWCFPLIINGSLFGAAIGDKYIQGISKMSELHRYILVDFHFRLLIGSDKVHSKHILYMPAVDAQLHGS